jgi:hypothetical protein
MTWRGDAVIRRIEGYFTEILMAWAFMNIFQLSTQYLGFPDGNVITSGLLD